jgi:hypothetical protein
MPVTMYCTDDPLVALDEVGHAVLDHLDDRAADEGVDHPALATEQAGAADHGRADREQQVFPA